MAQFLFVNPSTHLAKGATSVALTMPPLGLASLAAVVERLGHGVQIIDANLEQVLPDVVASLVRTQPKVIGMPVNILTIKPALAYARALKDAYPDALIVLGGPYASVMGRRVLENHHYVDAIAVGEGEGSLEDMANRINEPNPFKDVAGVLYRTPQGIMDNGSRSLIEDADQLPMPAYHLLPHLSRYRTRSRAFPVGYVFTSRGCPAACTFCYRNFGARWRPRSPENVLEEIERLRADYGIQQLDILDDNFTFDEERAARILELIIRRRWRLKINLQIGVRVQSLTPELLRIMRRAGVFKFGFGVESGDAAMLRRIKKGLQLHRAVSLVRTARSMGFVTHGYFIIGFPGDTAESMQRTIDFAVQLNPHYASFSICTPLPGTEVYDDIEKNGEFVADLRDGLDEGLFALKGFFRYGKLTPELASDYCERAWRLFYGRPGKVADVLSTVRSPGELLWLLRVVGDMLRTKRA